MIQHALAALRGRARVQKLLKLFGYRQGELEGKNVSMLMPQPFAGRHNGYLHNYQTTGKAQILGSQREVRATGGWPHAHAGMQGMHGSSQPGARLPRSVAAADRAPACCGARRAQVVGLHKERHVFPLSLVVSKVSGSGAEAIFMALLKPSAEDDHSVKAWMMPGEQAGGQQQLAPACALHACSTAAQPHPRPCTRACRHCQAAPCCVSTAASLTGWAAWRPTSSTGPSARWAWTRRRCKREWRREQRALDCTHPVPGCLCVLLMRKPLPCTCALIKHC